MNNNFIPSTLILLAGGKSSRMGKPKGLLHYKATLWILHQIETFIGSEVFIGLGYDYQLYFDAIPWFKDALKKPVPYKGKNIRIIINTTPEFGLFSNLQSVLNHVNTNQQVLVLPIDVPLFNHKEQEKLFEEKNSIAIPKYRAIKGHPIKLQSNFWKTLLEINLSDKDARLDYKIKKITSSEISFVETFDEVCIQNLNTPKDWQTFISD